MADLIIGFDTEYRGRRPDDEVWEPGPNDNIELVRTACIMNPETGQYVTLAHYPAGKTRRHRTALFPFVGACLREAIEANLVEKKSDGKYSIQLAAHFTRADLPSFRDFKTLKKRFDSVRGTFCTMGRPAVFNGRVLGIGRCRFSVTLIDTMLHAPATHQSLSALGDALEFPKIELPNGMIERMDILLQEDPELFERYAIRDAVLAATLVREMSAFYRDTLGVSVSRFPVTLSSAGVRKLIDGMATTGPAIENFLGVDEKRNPWTETSICNRLGAEAYHGGRNEAFWVGPTPEGVRLYDIDLAGAYTAVMAAFRAPDWRNFMHTTEIDRLTVIDAGMSLATVRFKFPPNTRFPSLPVRGQEGLFYPLSGETTVTGAELVVALEQGAEIEILEGIFIPWLGEERPLLAFTQLIQEIRRVTKGSLQERLAKEIGNSLYGKFAQAVSGMRQGGRSSTVFDSRTGKDAQLPPSRITQPCIAAWITGICRAVVSELLARMPDEAIVCSVTTDGLLSSVALEEMDVSGPLCCYFQELRELAAPDTPAFEIKHIVKRAFILRTRGALTMEPSRPLSEASPMMARAGNRLDDETMRQIREQAHDKVAAEWTENDTLLDHAATRRYGQKSEQRRKLTLREQWRRNADLTETADPVEVSVSMDFDLKRQIVDAKDGWLGCFSASTKPWPTLADAETARDIYRRWRQAERRVLRSLEDLQSLNDELSGVTGEQARTLPRGDRFAKAVRIAAANGRFGFADITNDQTGRQAPPGFSDLERRLTFCGVETSRHQLYRLRGKELPDGIHLGPEHRGVFAKLRFEFSNVDWNALAGVKIGGQARQSAQTIATVCDVFAINKEKKYK